MGEELHGTSALTTPRPDELSRDKGDSAGARRGRVGSGLPVVDQQHVHTLKSAFWIGVFSAGGELAERRLPSTLPGASAPPP